MAQFVNIVGSNNTETEVTGQRELLVKVNSFKEGISAISNEAEQNLEGGVLTDQTFNISSNSSHVTTSNIKGVLAVFYGAGNTYTGSKPGSVPISFPNGFVLNLGGSFAEKFTGGTFTTSITGTISIIEIS